MLSLDEIFKQAEIDRYTVTLNRRTEQAKLLYGIIITKHLNTGLIEIKNNLLPGDDYTPLNNNEISIFKENGWRNGVYITSLDNYHKMLTTINHNCLNVSSKKELKELKIQKKRIFRKYTEIKNKLNQKS